MNQSHRHEPEPPPPVGPEDADAPRVRRLLRNQATPAMPAAVAEAIGQALAHEQELRELTEFSPDGAADDLVEAEERTSLGSFGPNPPRAFTKRALGIQEIVEP